MTEDSRSKLEIDWLRTVAGALAAVSSAVLLSTLGAAGTIIGAALGSVIVTVGGAVYSAGLARSRARLAEAQTLALRKVGVAQAEVRRAGRRQGEDEAVEAHLAHADEQLDEARDDLDVLDDLAAPEASWRDRFAGLPWKRISLLAGALFVVSVVIITVFELVAGESVSSITGGTDGDGGTTVSHLGGSGDKSRDDTGDDEQRPSDDEASPGADPSDEAPPSDQPSAVPNEEPSDEPSEEPATPTPTPTEPTVTIEPTATPTAG